MHCLVTGPLAPAWRTAIAPISGPGNRPLVMLPVVLPGVWTTVKLTTLLAEASGLPSERLHPVG